jgi:phosphoenolpyruvate carboxykinase (ATP)
MPEYHLKSKYGLDNHGLKNLGHAHWNHNTPALYEAIIRRQEGRIVHLGPVVVRTGSHTGRAAKDKFIVAESSSEDLVWWGNINKPYSEEQFKLFFRRVQAYLQGKEVYVQDCYAGADLDYQMPIRVITETAWHNLFARNMFIQAPVEALESHIPEFTILHVPNFQAEPELDSTHSEAFILLNLGQKLVLIGGTSYAGEIKKSIFTVMNYLLPQSKVLSMHCSANMGTSGDVALFFGLSGTGKTTLSADAKRRLIGDDEHGWSDNGIFNFEGGCYAKVIGISKEHEPEIYETTRRFGTILENVGYDTVTRRLDLNDASLTQNTRAAYPLPHIPNAIREKRGGQPKNLIMLTSDAFGVLPPIAKLTPAQAMYHFVSGYTAKLAGTEIGITEPQATFSACFGEPFMVLHPFEYARLLREKVAKYEVDCWLVNTGWTGGPHGEGKRMHLPYTRAMVNAAIEGRLSKVMFEKDPIFRINVPTSVPDVPAEILNPRNTWQNKKAYDLKAQELANKFNSNFSQYSDQADNDLQDAGPNLTSL